jgi:hypothetical protein
MVPTYGGGWARRAVEGACREPPSRYVVRTVLLSLVTLTRRLRGGVASRGEIVRYRENAFVNHFSPHGGER